MAWKQVREPNLSTHDIPGWCLRLVLHAFGFNGGAAFARSEWDRNTTKHADYNFPPGVAVPIFYSWVGTIDGVTRDWGDVAIRLPDGRVFGTPMRGSENNRLDPNIESRRVAMGGNAKYLGWTETLNGTKIIEWQEENMPTLIDEEGVRILAAGVLERPEPLETTADLRNHIGGDALAKIKEFWYSPEGRAANAWRQSIRGQLAAVQAQAQELALRPTKENFDKLQDQITQCVAGAEASAKQLQELRDEKAADEQAGNSFLRWIFSKFRKDNQ